MPGLYLRKVMRIAPCSNETKEYIITMNAPLFPAEQKTSYQMRRKTPTFRAGRMSMPQLRNLFTTWDIQNVNLS